MGACRIDWSVVAEVPPIPIRLVNISGVDQGLQRGHALGIVEACNFEAIPISRSSIHYAGGSSQPTHSGAETTVHGLFDPAHTAGVQHSLSQPEPLGSSTHVPDSHITTSLPSDGLIRPVYCHRQGGVTTARPPDSRVGEDRFYEWGFHACKPHC